MVKIKVKDYEAFVAGNAMMPIEDIGYSVIGLAGETGEVAEWVKKRVYRGNEKFTEDMLMSELGDVVHYVTRIALHYGMSLKDIMAANVEKLQKREGLNGK